MNQVLYCVILLVSIKLCLCENTYDDLGGDDWQLVWNDEFNSTEIDSKLWNFELGDGCPDLCRWGNKEEQWYTNSTNNVFLTDGKLIIQAQRDKKRMFTSGRMITRGKGDWKFGKFDVRAKFPRGAGLMSNVWLLPTYEKFGFWPMSGAVDMAMMNSDVQGRSVHQIAHFGIRYNLKSAEENVETVQTKEEAFTESFHLFTFVWEKDQLQWFIDGIKVYELLRKEYDKFKNEYFTYPFNEKFHLVLSLAIGGELSGNSDATPFPRRLELDYIRVYQKLL